MANFPFAVKDLQRMPGWAAFSLLTFDTTPWAKAAKPLAECRVALVTSGGVVRKDDKPFNPRADWTWRKIASDTDLGTQAKILHDGFLHKDSDRDLNCLFPLHRLRDLAAAGFCRLSPLHASCMGLSVNAKPYRDRVAKEVVAAMQEAGAERVLLAPGCTVSHQAMALVARGLEEAGIPTVCVSLTREVTDALRVPRTALLKFPLGHPFGHPNEAQEQTDILKAALGVFDTVPEPGGVSELPFTWSSEYVKN